MGQHGIGLEEVMLGGARTRKVENLSVPLVLVSASGAELCGAICVD
jgi:hypothetical protein